MLSHQYVGGFFDADGSVGIYGSLNQGMSNPNHRKWGMHISFSNKDLPTLENIKLVTGGCLTLHKHRTGDCWRLLVPVDYLDILVENTHFKRKQLTLAREFIKFNKAFSNIGGPKGKPDWVNDIQAAYASKIKELK
jgi:hypothetical protein